MQISVSNLLVLRVPVDKGNILTASLIRMYCVMPPTFIFMPAAKCVTLFVDTYKNIS
jgi:hypothetical protein